MTLIFENVHGTGEVYMDCLKAICGDTEGKSMIDLCCCTAPNTPLLGFKERKYVDVLPRILDHPSEQEFFEQDDVLNFLNGPKMKYYDMVICSDGIEHLTKAEGYDLINLAWFFSEKQIYFTPLGDYMVDKNDTNPENHHSGWIPDDLSGNFHCIVFPHYHKLLNTGAFFFWYNSEYNDDFNRVKNILKNKSWATEAKQQK
jgi:hypothetical protein